MTKIASDKQYSAKGDDYCAPDIFWCSKCKVPIIHQNNSLSKQTCPSCNSLIKYISSDIRPVFPEERLLAEILLGIPFEWCKKSVWASNNRYYVDGKSVSFGLKKYRDASLKNVRDALAHYQPQNTYVTFNEQIARFVDANSQRLNWLEYEAFDFIQSTAKPYAREQVVVSFSGGKDSTVTADLVIRALGDPGIVHVFGNTTLEFPLTLDYVDKFRRDHPMTIFKTAVNKDQDFYQVCKDIGPPARMLRWCCSMFKTGPITRVFNNLYPNKDILTFYGIRKCESVSRSRYNRVESSADAVKIHKQKVASPIFHWLDIDIWLYLLGKNVDFNDAYRLGYDRVGCWCCPNNSARASLLAQIYMPEQAEKWREFLIGFAQRIGKPDAEEYVDTGAWKARQGGNGLEAAQDIKIRFSNCTTEEHANVYQLNKPMTDAFLELFIPFGRLAPELGRKLINETIVVDVRANVPVLSIQPFGNDNNEYTVKVKTMNVADHAALQRMVGYQIRKYNACRQCLKCESLCKFGAISIVKGVYHICGIKCKRCKMCVTDKYLAGGCLMQKYLKTKEAKE
jgi:phosphoadenosine phosphosulfate reductase